MDIKYQYIFNVSTNQLLEKFGHIMFPDLRKKRAALLPKTCDFVLAIEDHKIVGILVGAKQVPRKAGRILSFAVNPTYRRQGIGGQLLTTFEKGMLRQGIRELSVHYRSHWPGARILEKILSRATWSTPKVDFVIVKGRAEKVLQLFDKDKSGYPKNFYTVPWKDLSENQLEKINSRFLSKKIPADQNPFISFQTINKTCSLALFRNEVNVGWVVSHLISDSTNEFTSLYILPQYRAFGLAHKLMRETIFRQNELVTQSNFLIVSKASNLVMSRFLQRHAEKTRVKLIKTLSSTKGQNGKINH